MPHALSACGPTRLPGSPVHILQAAWKGRKRRMPGEAAVMLLVQPGVVSGTRTLRIIAGLIAHDSNTSDLLEDMHAGVGTVFGADCASHLLCSGGVRAGVDEFAEFVGQAGAETPGR